MYGCGFIMLSNSLATFWNVLLRDFPRFFKEFPALIDWEDISTPWFFEADIVTVAIPLVPYGTAPNLRTPMLGVAH